MPREVKHRRVCSEPCCRRFSPDHGDGDCVLMSVEELEAVRLCDLEGLEQQDAALRMNISRGTLQRVLYAARKNMAEALVMGKTLTIKGGNYEVADGKCKAGETCSHCCFKKQQET